MKRNQIVFTACKKAELLEKDIPEMSDNSVKIDMEYTVVSGGTERACIMGMPNAGGNSFPKILGYCGVGTVIETGSTVTKVKIGERCLVYHGYHTNINVVPEADVTKVESYPHHWTHHDDCNAIIDMIATKRIQVEPIVSRIESPVNAPQIYNELCDDKDFPIGTVFDWREM